MTAYGATTVTKNQPTTACTRGLYNPPRTVGLPRERSQRSSLGIAPVDWHKCSKYALQQIAGGVAGGAAFIGAHFALLAAEPSRSWVVVLDTLTCAGNLQNLRYDAGQLFASSEAAFATPIWSNTHFTRNTSTRSSISWLDVT